MFFFHKAPVHPIAAAYLEGTERRLAAKTPLSELTFVSLDCETTGFNSNRDRILSLALAELKAGRLLVARSQSWLLRQDRPATGAVTVHGILPSDTAFGQPESDVLLELLPRLQNAVIVGHHIGFDVAMINAALKRHYHIGLANHVLDTAKFATHAVEAFARTGYPGQRDPSLDEVCAQCGLSPTDRHTAEGDAFTTATLFLTLCARRQRQLGRPLRVADLPLVKA